MNRGRTSVPDFILTFPLLCFNITFTFFPSEKHN